MSDERQIEIDMLKAQSAGHDQELGLIQRQITTLTLERDRIQQQNWQLLLRVVALRLETIRETNPELYALLIEPLPRGPALKGKRRKDHG
jgi:FtsZ-binding cell division protein ZapB